MIKLGLLERHVLMVKLTKLNLNNYNPGLPLIFFLKFILNHNMKIR